MAKTREEGLEKPWWREEQRHLQTAYFPALLQIINSEQLTRCLLMSRYLLSLILSINILREMYLYDANEMRQCSSNDYDTIFAYFMS